MFRQCSSLILPIALLGVLLSLFRPPFPIDETRYLAVAWEMHWRDLWVVPMLEGSAYVQKPPLLFWLIRLGWLGFEVNAIWPRLIVGLFALATLWLTAQLARALAADTVLSDQGWAAALLLSALAAWPAWSVVLYFDVPLTFFVVAAAWAIVRLVRYGQGGWLFALALGGGVLMKGPLVAFPLVGIVLGIPWWATHLSVQRRWHLFWQAIGWGAAGALLPAGWLLAVAMEAGSDTLWAIFVAQGFGRLGPAADHAAPWWWYLPVIAVLLWPLGWRRWFWLGAFQAGSSMTRRFALLAIVPAVLLLSFVSGKRVQYLLPLLPFVAILARDAWERLAVVSAGSPQPMLRRRWAGVGEVLPLWLAALLLLIAPFVPRWQEEVAWLTERWAVVGLGLALIGWGYRWWETQQTARQEPAIGALPALCRLVMPQVVLVWSLVVWLSLTAAWASKGAFDAQPLAERLAQWRAEGRAVVWVGGRHHAAWHFAARRQEPLPIIASESLQQWLADHPGGVALVAVKRRRQATDACLVWRSDWVCPIEAKHH